MLVAVRFRQRERKENPTPLTARQLADTGQPRFKSIVFHSVLPTARRCYTVFNSYRESLLSGQNANNSNWLVSVAASDLSGIAESADWIGIFSNTVTERTCSNV